MKRVNFLFLILSVFIFSCQKEESKTQEYPEKVTDYFPLKVGNYWIYKTSTCDSLEFGCEDYDLDSVYISGTKIIDGNIYYRMSGLLHNSTMLYRDSGDYIIDSIGRIIFALNHFNTPIYEYEETYSDKILFMVSYSINSVSTEIDVPAGVFSCYNVLGTVWLEKDNFTTPRYIHNNYAEGVGLVYKTMFYLSSETGIKQELIRYHLEE